MELIANTAIVTGGSRGIGYGIADLFMEMGATVVITARGEEVLNKAAAELTSRHGTRAVPVVCDVSRSDDVARLFETATAELGDIGIVVNNAGNSTLDRIANMPEGDWDSVLGTHLKGTFLGTQQAINHMKAHGRGRVILNISSIESFRTTTGNAHYSAAKAGIDKFTEVAALETGPFGIRVNCVEPGAVQTTIGDDLPAEGFAGLNAAWQETFSAGRPGVPQDIAQAVAFLASDYASWITGVTLLVDGGSHLHGLPDYAKFLLPSQA